MSIKLLCHQFVDINDMVFVKILLMQYTIVFCNKILLVLNRQQTQTIKNPQTMSHIVAFGVYYVPNKQGKLFAGLKCELQQAFNNQNEAISYCDSLNMGGLLDELHIGYRVYPMQWIPKGVTLR